MRPIALIFAVLSLVAPALAAAQRLPRPLRTGEGPTAVVDEDRAAAGARLANATITARVEIPVSRGGHVPTIAGDGAVTLVEIDGVATLITPFAWVAGASSIELLLGDQWVPATTLHGSTWYDLTALVVEVPLPENLVPLVLADSFAVDPVVFVATPAGAPDAEVAVTAFGLPPGDTEAWYVRALTPLRNGFALVDREYRLLAITSIAARDSHGGTYALSYDRIRTWADAWPSIDRGESWDTQVIDQIVTPVTGSDALR
jgi:hypothetical protein